MPHLVHHQMKKEAIKCETGVHLIGVTKEHHLEYTKDDILNCAMPVDCVLNLHVERKNSAEQRTARNLHSLTLRRVFACGAK